MELRRYWKIISRRKWVFIIAFIIVLATIVIGANIIEPSYEARAKIHIDSSEALASLMASLELPVSTIKSTADADNPYETEIALATIRPLLEDLISALNLQDRNGETIKPDALIESSIMNKFSPQPFIEIEQYEDSNLLEIISTSNDPKQAAEISNNVAQLFMKSMINLAKSEYRDVHAFLNNRIKDIQEKYINALLEKKNFMIKEGITDLQTESANLLDYLDELQNDRNKNEIAIAQAKKNLSYVKGKIEGKKYATTDIINTMESKLNDLVLTVTGKSVELSSEHPDVIVLNSKIDSIKKYLQERSDVIISGKEVPIAPIFEELIKNMKDASINIKVGEIKRNLLNKHIGKTKDELIKIPVIKMDQSEIDLTLSINQEIYQNLLTYLTKVSVAKSVTLSNIRLVEPAIESDEAAFPKKTISYIVGILMSGFWGIFLVFLFEYLDNTVKEPEDMMNYGYTILGHIPKIKGERIISKVDPDDPAYESYQRALSNIRYAVTHKPCKKLMISSTGPKEGSSTTAANLGILLSREGKKALLVDADIRRPSMHSFFGVPGNAGLVDLLLNNGDIKEMIIETGIEGLNLLPSGTKPPDTGLLIKSHKMRELISNLEKEYDTILFHCAPLSIKEDAFILMEYLDNMIIVVRNNVTTHKTLSKVDRLFRNARITPVGVILNCV